MHCIMQLIAPADPALARQQGYTGAWDGQYLAAYHPEQRAANLIEAAVEVTPDPARAQRFPDEAAARACWMTARGVRAWDGRPDRPLTAFTVQLVAVSVPAAEAPDAR